MREIATHARIRRIALLPLLLPTLALAQPAPQAQGPGRTPDGPPAPADFLRRLDRDADGSLSREEFPERMRPMFDRTDANSDGRVSVEELAAARQRAGQRRPGAQGQAPQIQIPEGVRAETDLPYAGTDHPRQKLDLYLPKNPKAKTLPVIVSIHGGGWQAGDKRSGARFLIDAVASGEYAGVSVGYRLTDAGPWPIQIHDCKAAIRWIRANAERYGIDPERIGLRGPSAGGHLVAMLGTSAGIAEIDGALGPNADQKTNVRCVVDFFGPTDIASMDEGRPEGAAMPHSTPDSPESKLLGGTAKERPDVAAQASPLTHVSPDDPPFLIVHGTLDPLVPFRQSEILHGALQKAGVKSNLIRVEGGGHGQGFPPEIEPVVRAFFDLHLRGVAAEIGDQTFQAVAAPQRPRR